MRVYREYTVTSSREILCLFKCEKCGEMNLTKLMISGQAQYDDRSAGFRKATVDARMEERNRLAKGEAADQLEGLIADLELNLSLKTLLNAGIRCKCHKCGKEPWWTMKILRTLVLYATLLSMLAFIMLLLFSGLNGPIVVPTIAAAVLCWAGYLVYRRICSKRVETRELPLFAENIEKMREKKNKSTTYMNFSI